MFVKHQSEHILEDIAGPAGLRSSGLGVKGEELVEMDHYNFVKNFDVFHMESELLGQLVGELSQ